jgi:hypothetical protein
LPATETLDSGPDTTAVSADTTVEDPSASAPDAPPISGQEICDLVSGDVVGTALGITIDHVVASTSDTPQCAYVFADATGADDNVTVAAMRTEEDLGGRTGDDAFAYVADLNRTISAGGDTTETELEAGDRATLFAGSTLSLGVIDIGGRIVTVIVPPSTGAATTEAISPLIVAVANAFA